MSRRRALTPPLLLVGLTLPLLSYQLHANYGAKVARLPIHAYQLDQTFGHAAEAAHEELRREKQERTRKNQRKRAQAPTDPAPPPESGSNRERLAQSNTRVKRFHRSLEAYECTDYAIGESPERGCEPDGEFAKTLYVIHTGLITYIDTVTVADPHGIKVVKITVHTTGFSDAVPPRAGKDRTKDIERFELVSRLLDLASRDEAARRGPEYCHRDLQPTSQEFAVWLACRRGGESAMRIREQLLRMRDDVVPATLLPNFEIKHHVCDYESSACRGSLLTIEVEVEVVAHLASNRPDGFDEGGVP